MLEVEDLDDEELDDEELEDEELDDVELEGEELEEDELLEVEPVPGTPPGPATICKIFSDLMLKIAGASETWLLSRS